MYFKNILSLVSVLFLSTSFLTSCENSTQPEELKHGRRDYIWTEDTLNVPEYDYLDFRHITGKSPNDIWIGTLDASHEVCLWHYNGSKWKTVDFPHKGHVPSALLLCDGNTLWAGTPENYIWKREKGIWSKSYKIELEGYNQISIYGMDKEAENNIYAVGWATNYIKHTFKSIILHYNGEEWNFVDIPELYVGFNDIFYQKDIKTYFIQGTNVDHGFLDKVYTFDGKNLKEIISTYQEAAINKIDGKVYIDSEEKVYTYRNNKLVLWKDFSGTGFRAGLAGRNKNDLFSTALNGLWHYNGNDQKIIYETHLGLQRKIAFEKEVFIEAQDWDNNTYIILHGKLK